MTRLYRTPDERFEELPGFPYEPVYREVDGLRLAHVDVGEGAPVLLLHGSPAYSLIWRKVIPPLVDAGYRCVAPDQAGYGRSDKPTDLRWYSLERQVELGTALLDDLGLRDATIVVHDWGGPIGIRMALARPDRIARIVVLDTALDHRETWMNETWVRIFEFIQSTADLPVGEIMRATAAQDLGEDVVAAYAAPFPVPESSGALKGMMASIPAADNEGAAAAVEELYEQLRADRRPMLFVWAEADLFLTLATGQRLAASIGREIDHVVADAGHALPEDQGEEIARLMVDWLAETR